MDWRLAVVAGLATAAASLLLTATPAGASPREPLGHEGRWTTDAKGRVVVLHGMNMVIGPRGTPRRVGFDRDDARFLRRNGFNTVRLGLFYERLERRPGRYDNAYLDSIARTARLLARERISVLLDFHQDMYNATFQGRGFPDWAVQDDGLPHEPRRGFPFNYYFMPALQHAYDNFWENSPGPGDVGLQDRYAAAWRHVAKRMRHLRGLVGYDIINEPSPGSSTAECSTWSGCPAFDRGPLTDFNRRVFSAIRKADRRHLVWHEPHVGFGFGNPSFTRGTGGRRSGFSFHMYCIGVPGFSGGETRPCSEVNADIFRSAEDVSRRTGDALLLSEFGANVRYPDSVVEAVTLADEFMVGWQHWHYANNVAEDPTQGFEQVVVRDATKPPRGDNIDHDRLELLVRPYPQAIAGTPVRWRFEPAKGSFLLVFKTRSVGKHRLPVRARTEVVVPRLQYPDGYRATASGGRVTSRRDAKLLRIAAKRKPNGKPKARTIKVRVKRR